MEITAKPAVKTILDEPFVKITYHAESGVLSAKWIGFLKLENIKKGCAAMNDCIKAQKVTRHFSDQSDLKILTKDIQEYIATVWFAEADKMGLRKFGILAAEDIFAGVSVNKVNTEMKVGKIDIQTFGSQQKCMQWLTE